MATMLIPTSQSSAVEESAKGEPPTLCIGGTSAYARGIAPTGPSSETDDGDLPPERNAQYQ